MRTRFWTRTLCYNVILKVNGRQKKKHDGQSSIVREPQCLGGQARPQELCFHNDQIIDIIITIFCNVLWNSLVSTLSLSFLIPLKQLLFVTYNHFALQRCRLVAFYCHGDLIPSCAPSNHLTTEPRKTHRLKRMNFYVIYYKKEPSFRYQSFPSIIWWNHLT